MFLVDIANEKNINVSSLIRNLIKELTDDYQSVNSESLEF
jgi:hypothetical protein